jgi:hypothetical protein
MDAPSYQTDVGIMDAGRPLRVFECTSSKYDVTSFDALDMLRGQRAGESPQLGRIEPLQGLARSA